MPLAGGANGSMCIRGVGVFNLSLENLSSSSVFSGGSVVLGGSVLCALGV